MADIYWVRIGDQVTGPHTVAALIGLLAADTVQPDTPTCAVGQADWQPLHRVSGVGPPAFCLPPTAGTNRPALPVAPSDVASEPETATLVTPAAAVAVVPPAVEAASAPRLPPKQTRPGTVADSAAGASGFAVIVLVLWLGYEGFRSLSANEVILRWDAAKTPAEADLHAIPLMQTVSTKIFTSADMTVGAGDIELRGERMAYGPDSAWVGMRFKYLVVASPP